MPHPAAVALLQAFQKTVDGLLVTSESDYPIAVIGWWRSTPQPPTVAEIVAQAGNQQVDPVQAIDWREFLEPMAQFAPWFGAAEQEQAKQFQDLVRLIAHDLTHVVAYRVGAVAIDVYIVGRVLEAVSPDREGESEPGDVTEVMPDPVPNPVPDPVPDVMPDAEPEVTLPPDRDRRNEWSSLSQSESEREPSRIAQAAPGSRSEGTGDREAASDSYWLGLVTRVIET